MTKQPTLDPVTARRFTDAPMRIAGTFRFEAAPEVVFERVTDPRMIAGWFAMIRGGTVDHSGSCNVGAWGAGTKRQCQTWGMGTLDETILHWEAPHRCLYSVRNLFMPIKDHCAVMAVEPDGSGSRFTWEQHFRLKGLFMRWMFPWMMTRMMNGGLEKLRQELGGEGGRIRRVG
jgi:hypothetical protein